MTEGNKFPLALLTTYRAMFESTIAFLWEVLGTDAFTLLGLSKRPTKIVYDPLMFVANSSAVIKDREILKENKTVLRRELEGMYRSNRELFSGRRTNFTDTQDRNLRVNDAFVRAIASAKS
jgi:hypothetical protein